MTMTEDDSQDTETLFARLCALFAQDPFIDEIGLVFGVEEAELTVENAFFLEEHKLGVAFSAGPQLFKQARTRFHELNPLLLSNSIDSDSNVELSEQLIDCTRAILLISADFYTAWNTRKELVCRGVLDALEETRFCDLVFTLHPKSIDTWAYRRWLATRLLPPSAPSSSLLTSDALSSFYERQLDVCSLLAEQKPRNYHAWSFRHWIVSQLPLEALEGELQRMQQWCASHITDHSGWNHRQHVMNVAIKRMREANPNASCKQLVVDEYAFLSKIMASYPQHEALWCHRRFVIQLVLRELNDDDGKGGFDLALLNQRVSELEAKVKLAEAETAARADTLRAESLLLSEWQTVEESLCALNSNSAHLALLAIIDEIEIAWSFQSRFSRRFALWCLERVRRASSCLVGSSFAELQSLANAMRARLSTQDPLLQNLWDNKRS